MIFPPSLFLFLLSLSSLSAPISISLSVSVFLSVSLSPSLFLQHEEAAIHLVAKYDHSHVVPVFATAKVDLDIKGKVRQSIYGFCSP